MFACFDLRYETILLSWCRVEDDKARGFPGVERPNCTTWARPDTCPVSIKAYVTYKLLSLFIRYWWSIFLCTSPTISILIYINLQTLNCTVATLFYTYLEFCAFNEFTMNLPPTPASLTIRHSMTLLLTRRYKSPSLQKKKKNGNTLSVFVTDCKIGNDERVKRDVSGQRQWRMSVSGCVHRMVTNVYKL